MKKKEAHKNIVPCALSDCFEYQPRTSIEDSKIGTRGLHSDGNYLHLLQFGMRGDKYPDPKDLSVHRFEGLKVINAYCFTISFLD